MLPGLLFVQRISPSYAQGFLGTSRYFLGSVGGCEISSHSPVIVAGGKQWLPIQSSRFIQGVLVGDAPFCPPNSVVHHYCVCLLRRRVWSFILPTHLLMEERSELCVPATHLAKKGLQGCNEWRDLQAALPSAKSRQKESLHRMGF